MYQIGDQVVHPLHGAGQVVDIVERTIDGVCTTYYALTFARDETQLFIPLESCGKLGVRPVCSRAEAEAFVRGLEHITCGPDKSWNQRYRENMLHLRSGDLNEVAQVVKSLAARDRERGLSTGEKKMLASARQILESELCAALGRSPEAVAAIIDQHLCI